MCNLSEGVYQDGIQKGMIEGKAEAINAIMKKFKCTIDDAFDTLEITNKEEQERLRQLLTETK